MSDKPPNSEIKEKNSGPLLWRFLIGTSKSYSDWYMQTDKPLNQEANSKEPEVGNSPILEIKPEMKIELVPPIPDKLEEDPPTPTKCCGSCSIDCILKEEEVKQIVKESLESQIDRICSLESDFKYIKCPNCGACIKKNKRRRSRSKKCKKRSRSRGCSENGPILPKRSDASGKFRKWKSKKDIPERDFCGRFVRLRRYCDRDRSESDSDSGTDSDSSSESEDDNEKRCRPKSSKKRSRSKCPERNSSGSKGRRILPERGAKGRFCKWKSKRHIPERDSYGRFVRLRRSTSCDSKSLDSGKCAPKKKKIIRVASKKCKPRQKPRRQKCSGSDSGSDDD